MASGRSDCRPTCCRRSEITLAPIRISGLTGLVRSTRNGWNCDANHPNPASIVSASLLDNLFGLQGRLAVVIGGAGVLGGALAEGIAQAGATTIVAGRGGERGEARGAATKKTRGEAALFP